MPRKTRTWAQSYPVRQSGLVMRVLLRLFWLLAVLTIALILGVVLWWLSFWIWGTGY